MLNDDRMLDISDHIAARNEARPPTPEAANISVLLLSSCPVYRAGFVAKGGDVHVVPMDPSAEHDKDVDVVVLDARVGPWERTEGAAKRWPAAKIVVVNADRRYTAEAAAHVSPDETLEVIFGVVRLVHHGYVVPPRESQSDTPDVTLTEDESIALRLMASGYRVSRISKELCRSEASYKRLVQGLKRKLRVETTHQAVAWAAARHLL